jgi:uncharacterized damage-inducible protein DinB
MDRDFDIGHRTLRETIDHLAFNIDAWTAMMEGRPLSEDRDASSFDALRRRVVAAYDRFTAFALRAREEGRLDDTFRHAMFPSTHTISSAILHVSLHDEWHRSEIAHILQRLGVDPVPEADHALWDAMRHAGEL